MRKALLCTAILLAVLVACAPGERDGEALDLATPFIGGTSGLSAEFVEFRTEVFDGGRDPFDIVIKVENAGESSVTADRVRVKLSGINPAAFGKLEEDLSRSPPDDVVAARILPDGTVVPASPVFVEFTELNHFTPIAGAQFNYPLRAELCYLYTTQAVSKLCVRENILAPEAGGICEINEAKPVFNSGAPVQIASIKESARAKDKISFTFEITNAGTGDTFERGSVCDTSTRAKQDRVYVIVDTGMPGISCTGLSTSGTKAEGFTTLFGGKKVVTCTQAVTTRTDFEQQINIEIVYDYEQYIQTDLTVKSSGEAPPVGVTE